MINKYTPGQFFKPHYDGKYHNDKDGTTSILSILLYLNENYSGGELLWGKSLEKSIKPEQGQLLVFPHDVWHEAKPVTKGEKFVLKGSIVFQLANTLGFKIQQPSFSVSSEIFRKRSFWESFGNDPRHFTEKYLEALHSMVRDSNSVIPIAQINMCPKDIWCYIFNFLSFTDLAAASQVCKQWYHAARVPSLYFKFARVLEIPFQSAANFRGFADIYDYFHQKKHEYIKKECTIEACWIGEEYGPAVRGFVIQCACGASAVKNPRRLTATNRHMCSNSTTLFYKKRLVLNVNNTNPYIVPLRYQPPHIGALPIQEWIGEPVVERLTSKSAISKGDLQCKVEGEDDFSEYYVEISEKEYGELKFKIPGSDYYATPLFSIVLKGKKIVKNEKEKTVTIFDKETMEATLIIPEKLLEEWYDNLLYAAGGPIVVKENHCAQLSNIFIVQDLYLYRITKRSATVL